MNSYWYTQALVVDPDEAAEWLKVIEPAIEAKQPEYPPECWNDRPINAEACVAATRAMCK